MKKAIIAVFGIIGVLVLCFLVWAMVFKGGLAQGWNAIAGQINGAWETITGSTGGDGLLPLWEDTTANNVEDAKGLID